MVKTKATKEETLAKFKAAREKKRTCLANLEKSMKEAYKKRTGKEAETFFCIMKQLLSRKFFISGRNDRRRWILSVLYRRGSTLFCRVYGR